VSLVDKNNAQYKMFRRTYVFSEMENVMKTKIAGFIHLPISTIMVPRIPSLPSSALSAPSIMAPSPSLSIYRAKNNTHSIQPIHSLRQHLVTAFVLCIFGSIVFPPTTSTTATGAAVSAGGTFYDELIPGSDPFDAKYIDVALPAPPPTTPQPRIVGGSVAKPFMAQYFVLSGHDNDSRTNDYVCGATLIHSDMLVTAAHW
jgi:hypothetical protein